MVKLHGKFIYMRDMLHSGIRMEYKQIMDTCFKNILLDWVLRIKCFVEEAITKPDPLIMHADEPAASNMVSIIIRPGTIISARSLERPSIFFRFSNGMEDNKSEEITEAPQASTT